jgi:hypothetical protein
MTCRCNDDAREEMLKSFLYGFDVMTTDKQNRPDDEEDERDRRATNIFLLVAGVLVVGGGLWLVNALVDARKNQLCFESGRRNCNPISVPERTRD